MFTVWLLGFWLLNDTWFYLTTALGVYEKPTLGGSLVVMGVLVFVGWLLYEN